MIRTAQLSYSEETKNFSAFLSDIPNSEWIQTYSDACDQGLVVVSDKTGKSVTYTQEGENRDKEGDLEFLILKPTKKSTKEVPACIGTTLILFND